MPFTPDLDLFPKERFTCIIYGPAGAGKTTTALSLLKNPNLKIIHFALEATTLAAMRNCFNVYDIEAADEASFKSNTDGTFYDNIVKALFTTKGIDVATGKQVTLGKFNNYTGDTVLVFDGISALIETVTNRANSDAIVKKVQDNGMAVYGIGQKYIINLFNQLSKGTKAHVIALGHQKLADEKAVAKYTNIKPINPDFYTRSLVDQVAGMFTYCMYAKRNSMNNRFTLSVAETNAYTRDSIDREKFKQVAAEVNKELKQHERIDLSNLPTDLTHVVYDFLK
jgi:hypothetical protein